MRHINVLFTRIWLFRNQQNLSKNACWRFTYLDYILGNLFILMFWKIWRGQVYKMILVARSLRSVVFLVGFVFIWPWLAIRTKTVHRLKYLVVGANASSVHDEISKFSQFQLTCSYNVHPNLNLCATKDDEQVGKRNL